MPKQESEHAGDYQMGLIRFILRFVATFLLAGAIVLAVLDATRSVAADQIVMTPLVESWQAVAPGALVSLRDMLGGPGSVLWDPIAVGILSLPGFVVLGVFALLFFVAGRSPRRSPVTGRVR